MTGSHSRVGSTAVKRRIKALLAKVDIGVYRPSRLVPASVEGFDASFLPEVDTVIDAGVAYGTGWLYGRFPSAQLVLVDPVSNADLDRVIAGRPHTFVAAALGSARGTAEMNVDLDQSGASSLLERTELTQTGSRRTTRTVEVRSLDDVVAEHVGADARIGLKLDIEGFELEALNGAKQTLSQCAFVVCETSVLKRFEDSYRFEDLVCFMRDQGFGVGAVLAADADPQGRIRFLDLAFLPYDEVRRKR